MNISPSPVATCTPGTASTPSAGLPAESIPFVIIYRDLFLFITIHPYPFIFFLLLNHEVISETNEPQYHKTPCAPSEDSELPGGERGGSVVECRTPEREVRGSRPTAAVLCLWARHFTPRKYWLITQEAMAPSRHDWKIVDWDVKPQHNQPTKDLPGHLPSLISLRCSLYG